MSLVQDGAGAPTSVREDSGITSHGICVAKSVIPGMFVYSLSKLWMEVDEVEEVGGYIQIRYGYKGLCIMLAEPMEWLMIREKAEAGHTYTEM